MSTVFNIILKSTGEYLQVTYGPDAPTLSLNANSGSMYINCTEQCEDSDCSSAQFISKLSPS